jgi:predicted RNA-binding Zn ribbon-like protein
MNDPEQTEAWSLVAGDLALAFVNTVGGNDSTADLDAIADYEQLLIWSLRAGAIDQDQADRLGRRARRRPDEADQVMQRARRLRTDLYAVFEDLVVGDPVAPAWIKVRPAVAAAIATSDVVVAGSSATWTWAGVRELDAPLHPVAHAAASLLTRPHAALLRRCDRCRWLFLDHSRNHARRWCDMRTCGVAEKIERQAERRRRS